LLGEIDKVASRLPNRRRVTQLHFGGGTPTVLDSPRLEQLVGALKSAFDFSAPEELALEAAPAVTAPEQIETLGKLGFNRISFGVQDFTPEVQQAVDRVQSVPHTLSLIETARSLGFAVNLDLMYGLPRQRLDTWEENLKQVIDLKPSRLAVFGYAHVPWMRPHQQLMNEAELPDADLRLALFRTAHDRLTDAGYVYIGMDHFALPGDALSRALSEKRLSRNFQGYTVKQAQVLLGFGATAISDLGSAFAQNHPKTAEYKALAAAGLATFRGMVTSFEDRLRRFVITEIMCNLVLRFKEVEERFQIKFAEHFAKEQTALSTLEADGLITREPDRIEVTDIGRLFVRHAGLVFDTYSKPKTDGPKFSRTV
jgi:oxygen-independent coproporphyrinogen-3 oxidase